MYVYRGLLKLFYLLVFRKKNHTHTHTFCWFLIKICSLIFHCPPNIFFFSFFVFFKSSSKIQMEAQHINKSQTFLQQVVAAMADEKRKHIPFRQSKLTYFLKDSIGGNCNTILIANIWSETEQIDETVRSFDYLFHFILFI